jgi:hypothetical protein
VIILFLVHDRERERGIVTDVVGMFWRKLAVDGDVIL